MSLISSIADIWENDAELTALIPFDRVFTGRVPQTELQRFPYVSILSPGGRQFRRSDKARHTFAPVFFHIWLDEDKLETGERVADKISDVYADRCWFLTPVAKVNDVLDEGEPSLRQPLMPTIKAWEVVKMLTFLIERARTAHDDECCSDGSLSSDSCSL
jgi:hypothetical protein